MVVSQSDNEIWGEGIEYLSLFLKVVLKFRSTGQIARGIELDVEHCMSYRRESFWH